MARKTTLLADYSGAHCERDHLGAVAGAELAGDPGEVALDGQGGEAEDVADLLVRLAVGDEAEHLDLAAGQLGDAGVDRATTQAGGQQRGDRRVGVHAAVKNSAYAVSDNQR